MSGAANLTLLGWIPALPLLGFLLLVVTQGRLPRLAVAAIGAGSMVVAAILTAVVAITYAGGEAEVYVHTLWQWMDVGGFDPAIRLYLDGLSLVMISVINGVGLLIHLYATGYMADEADYSRFFAYMNLFVFAMLMLVLGDNLLVLYLGWEGVGLCSYLLIGYFHTDPANGYAARKAFVVTRVGDTAMAFGLFLLFRELGTIEIQALLSGARETWPEGAAVNTLIALLLLGGAVGKSAQVPLQTWLPDAMAGPTPVSALIHAATMVTAGVYLIARTHDLYLLSSTAQFTVACVGLATLAIAAISALAQRDLKRILAYSTMSQIGYMFFALGVGAWSAAIFHLMTHAFFKALLFLSAGSVILALHHEQDIFKMGGLRKQLPIPFACMLIGAAALAALPLTSGFYSKDVILLTAYDTGSAGPWFWAVAAFAALITAIYSTRMICIVFFGKLRTESHDHSGWNMNLPLLVLAALALGGGWFGLSVVSGVLPDGGLAGAEHAAWLAWLTAATPIAGVVIGWFIYGRGTIGVPSALDVGATGRFLMSGWGFDALYDIIIVKPFLRLAAACRNEPVDRIYAVIVLTTAATHRVLAGAQSGSLRWYAANMGIGLALVLGLAGWLL